MDWTGILVGATIFGAIMALTAFINGRLTRKMLVQGQIQLKISNGKLAMQNESPKRPWTERVLEFVVA